ncbi:protein of unknown function [Streptomyces murinus]
MVLDAAEALGALAVGGGGGVDVRGGGADRRRGLAPVGERHQGLDLAGVGVVHLAVGPGGAQEVPAVDEVGQLSYGGGCLGTDHGCLLSSGGGDPGWRAAAAHAGVPGRRERRGGGTSPQTGTAGLPRGDGPRRLAPGSWVRRGAMRVGSILVDNTEHPAGGILTPGSARAVRLPDIQLVSGVLLDSVLPGHSGGTAPDSHRLPCTAGLLPRIYSWTSE